MKVVCLSEHPELALEYLNENCLHVGHLLPLNENQAAEYFPMDKSFLLLQGKKPTALFSYQPGVHKGTTIGRFRVVAKSKEGLGGAVHQIERTAIAQERLILRTTVFGYLHKQIMNYKRLGYNVCASLPETVSLDGKHFDFHLLCKDLARQYAFDVKRPYARPGLYHAQSVEKAKNARLKIRGYRPEDRPYLDKFASEQQVFRGIAGGLFEGFLPWPRNTYQELVDKRQVYPLVCEEESAKEPVGLLDLFRQSADVMQHTMGLGMYVKPEYQGIGVGTMLMESMKLLAKRLHLTRVWLSVFEGNTSAERLYRKTGFVECGKIPNWLQEGYVNEIFMTLKLD